MEKGGYLPNPSTVKKVADALGVTTDDILMDDAGEVLGAVGQAIAN